MLMHEGKPLAYHYADALARALLWPQQTKVGIIDEWLPRPAPRHRKHEFPSAIGAHGSSLTWSTTRHKLTLYLVEPHTIVVGWQGDDPPLDALRLLWRTFTPLPHGYAVMAAIEQRLAWRMANPGYAKRLHEPTPKKRIRPSQLEV